jgi:hypothetical protein
MSTATTTESKTLSETVGDFTEYLTAEPIYNLLILGAGMAGQRAIDSYALRKELGPKKYKEVKAALPYGGIPIITASHSEA